MPSSAATITTITMTTVWFMLFDVLEMIKTTMFIMQRAIEVTTAPKNIMKYR